jgi:hypothetical protein
VKGVEIANSAPFLLYNLQKNTHEVSLCNIEFNRFNPGRHIILPAANPYG